MEMGAMADVSFQFARVRTGGKTLWHVKQGGRFIGTVVEVGGHFEATRNFDGLTQRQRFPDREEAARWLASITPKQIRPK
jgi:hypothetical protein